MDLQKQRAIEVVVDTAVGAFAEGLIRACLKRKNCTNAKRVVI